VITCIKGKGKPAMLAGLFVILCFVYVCFFHLDKVMMVKPLFSGRNPFSALAYPKTGGLQRLIYYPVVILLILSLIAVTPTRKLLISEAGKRTMQVYFFHFSLIYLLRVTGVFDYLSQNLSGVLCELSFFVIALAITIFFSLPVWGLFFKPFRNGPSHP
jgi:fucose 4-O-acetylase-like acetyltransferase